MDDSIGISPLTSYVFLGLSLSIGYLVWILMRDANRRKKEREEREAQRVAELLKAAVEREKKAMANQAGAAMKEGERSREEGDASGKDRP